MPTTNQTLDQPLPIVMLHGFLGRGDDWLQLVNQFDRHSPCLNPDLPGHGGSLLDPSSEIAETAQALVAWLDRLGIAQTQLYGYSMGGRLALYLAVHWPDRFPGVLLESASPGLVDPRAQAQRRERDRLLALEIEQDFPAFLARWYEQPLFANLKRQTAFGAIYQRRLNNCPQSMAQSLRSMGLGMQPSLWERLPELRSKVVLLVGEQDEKFLAINQQMAALIPGAKLWVASGAGHTVCVEKPGVAIAALATLENA
jgi:2-succinyl-6-hydroxy-2,4-cyclohexadiene-1-carboxylate synthase